MSYETGPSKGSAMGFRSVYCSHSQRLATLPTYMIKGSAVAWTNATTVVDTGDGKGFGFCVDYPVATNSMVCGVLWSNDAGYDSFYNDRIAMAITKGLCPELNTYGAAAVGALMCSYDSIGWGSHFSALFLDPSMNWGVFAKALETEAGTTHSVVAWINTMY